MGGAIDDDASGAAKVQRISSQISNTIRIYIFPTGKAVALLSGMTFIATELPGRGSVKIGGTTPCRPLGRPHSVRPLFLRFHATECNQGAFPFPEGGGVGKEPTDILGGGGDCAIVGAKP